VVEVDGRVAVAGDQADLVAEPEPVGSGRKGEAAGWAHVGVLAHRTTVPGSREVSSSRSQFQKSLLIHPCRSVISSLQMKRFPEFSTNVFSLLCHFSASLVVYTIQ